MVSQVQGKALPTIWEVPSVSWSIVSAILVQAYPPLWPVLYFGFASLVLSEGFEIVAWR